MTSQRTLMFGIAASVILALGGLLFFFQLKDPMMLIFALRSILTIWVVILIVHVLRHGIPIRIVSDERRER